MAARLIEDLARTVEAKFHLAGSQELSTDLLFLGFSWLTIS